MTYKLHSSYILASRLKRCLGAGVLCLFLVLPTVVIADVIIAVHDWDTTPAGVVAPWVSQDGNASLAIADDGDNYLEISFDFDAVDTISTPADQLFAGTWQSEYWIEFDFWADSNVPDSLQIRWGTDEAPGRIWRNTLTPSGVGSWTTLRTDSFADYTDWNYGSGTVGEFITDLDSIDWIGVYIDPTAGTDVYGIDDFKLMVPEPAEYLLLFAALGTALVAIRRRKNFQLLLRRNSASGNGCRARGSIPSENAMAMP